MAQDKPYRNAQEDGKQTMILIGLLLVLILLVGGALLYVITSKGAPAVPSNQTNQTNQTPNPPPQNASNVTNMTNATVPCDDLCLAERGVAGNNISDCRLISNESLKQYCYGQLANASFDACKELTDMSRKKSCMTAFAVADNDITLCDLLTQGKDDCKLAVNSCYNATDKALCKALRDSNPSLCGLDSTCLLNYSFTKKNSSTCSLIQNNVVSKACMASVLYSDKCSELPKDAEQDYCYELFAIYTDDYLTCTQITPTSVYALDCYSTFAGKMKNLSICDRDDFDLNERWACFINYSLITGDLSGCEAIDELASTNQFRCSFEFAKKYGNPAACQLVSDSGPRSTCYQGAILYSNQNLDWHYCEDIIPYDWMNKCYIESAKLYNDVSLCDYITDEFVKESCKSSYAANKSD